MAEPDFNTRIIEEFRANAGRVGGPFEGSTLLLLHTDGARSGTHYTTPVVYLQDGGRYVIFASKAGAPSHPGWYHNLKAHPDLHIEVGDRTLDVTAAGADRRGAPAPLRHRRRADAAVRRVPGEHLARDPDHRADTQGLRHGTGDHEQARCVAAAPLALAWRRLAAPLRPA